MSRIIEGYKETEIGVVPEEWKVCELSSLSKKIGDGLHGTPKHSDDGKYYFVNGNNLKNGRIILSNDTKKVDQEEYEKYKVELSDASILISLNGTIGSLAYYNKENIILSKSAGYITLKDPKIKIYVFYVLQTSFVQNYILKELTGTTIRNLSLKTLRSIPIVLGEDYEQQYIAEILSTTDAHIEKLDKIIEEYQLLKKGMMNSLLTGGIGHTEFKETEIGKIPEEWEVIELKQIASLITKGTTPSTVGFGFVDDGINFIKVENINITGKIIERNLSKISIECHQRLNRSIIEANDILVSIAGTIGRTIVIPYDLLPANTNQALAIIRLKDFNKYDVKYINYTFSSDYFNLYIKSIKTVGAQPNMSLKQLQDYKLLLPPFEEQQQIASILSEIDLRIELYQQQREDFIQLKKALMERLLTGKIRVPLS